MSNDDEPPTVGIDTEYENPAGERLTLRQIVYAGVHECDVTQESGAFIIDGDRYELVREHDDRDGNTEEGES